MKKFTSLFLVFALSVSLTTGCSNESSNKKHKETDTETEDTSESIEESYSPLLPVEENGFFNCPVQVGDDISIVFETFDLREGEFEFDYEYDPYHDGCTDIERGVYDGTLVDFEENDVLDYMMIIYLYPEDGQWKKINLNSNSPEDFNGYITLFIDINGTAGAYDSVKPNKVMSIDIDQ